MTANAAKRLIAHYVDNFRDLPWRAPPGAAAADPYRVWLSEVMLQQTTVAAVIPRFERFVERWPTIEALAAANDEAVLSEWAGLGYYARARNLIACARAISSAGGFPTSESDLRRLPGIGDYTAAAIAAIAFGRRAIVVDTNVARVIARLHAVENPSKPQIRDFVAAMTPQERPGDFAQAMMDLGATSCRPRQPLCSSCPLQSDCAAFATGRPEAFPVAKSKAARPLRHGIAYWVERSGSVWLVRRPPKGMLGGMAALPGPEWSAEPDQLAGASIGRIRHVFTHFALDLSLVRRDAAEGDGWWHPISRIGEAGLPTLYRRAAELALTKANERRAA